MEKEENFSENSPDEVDGVVASCVKRNGEEMDPIDEYQRRFRDEVVISKTRKNDIYYSMDYPKKGLLLIFAHSEFTVANLKERKPEADVKSLNSTFSKLNFEIETTYMDKRLVEIRKIIREVRSRNFDDYASLVVAVSTHGSYSELFAKDAGYDPKEELFEPFKSVKTLLGKPKIFLLGACRGEKVDEGFSLYSTIETDGIGLEEYRIPVEADILVVYATPLGYISYSNEKYGAHFFRYLTEAIDENPDEHLLSIITIANLKMTIHYTSYSSDTPALNGNKQCISSMSTLTRLLKYNQERE